MIKIESGIERVLTGKRVETRIAIVETLKAMAVNSSFVIEGDIKKGTVKSVAKELKIKITIGQGPDGKTRCWKV